MVEAKLLNLTKKKLVIAVIESEVNEKKHVENVTEQEVSLKQVKVFFEQYSKK
tara:strand:+ start:163 stop:321 length:159 start_codon:yes stop_codon:yes gene_type:complete